jgi:hypothetical protein
VNEEAPAFPPEWRLKVGLFMAVLGVYLILGSGERPWSDSRIMYEVAENIVNKGTVEASTLWPPMAHVGRGGKVYGQYGFFASLVQVPGVWVRKKLEVHRGPAAYLTLPLTAHAASAVLGALTAVLLYGMCRRAGARPLAASLTSAVLAFATIVFVYARSPFSESLQTACFTGFCAELVRVPDEPDPRRSLAMGAWAGALLNAKLIYILSLGPAGLWLVWLLRKDLRALLRVVGFTMVTLLPLVVLALTFNWVRWGSPWLTGYESVYGNAREQLWAGLYSLWLSTGKGILFFSPPFIAALFGWPAFVRERPRAAVGLLLACLPPMIYTAYFLTGGGGYQWGSRYLTYLHPAALVPLAPLLDRLIGSRRWVSLGAVSALVGAGITVQLLGGAFYWDTWIRATQEAKRAWFGQADLRGAQLPSGGGCLACFEDMYAHSYLPVFSPIEGHWWLLKHVWKGDDWKAAEKDAPWKRYTSLDLNAKDSYLRAHLDWWGSTWKKDHGRGFRTGLLILCAMLLFFGTGLYLWIREVRLASPARV